MNGFRPRPGQREILEYAGGRMGVSAVPGSGKTAAVAALTAHLLNHRGGATAQLVPPGGRVLVVTYQTAAADTLTVRIREQLGHSPSGRAFDVRTLHSLSYGILKSHPGQAGTTADFQVVDERAGSDLLERAVRRWNAAHREEWRRLAPADREPADWERTWLDIATSVARRVVSEAKNRRRSVAEIEAGLPGLASSGRVESFLRLGIFVYRNYQQQLETMGGLDFNDMVRLAVEVLETHPDLRDMLAERWPVIVEDEAQDSLPLQEQLLELISRKHGNWVRVGDPNQAIMSSFTASDPASLRRFLEAGEVAAVEMAVSGRCSRRIIDVANHLVDWACDRHPVEQVRNRCFRRQLIMPTDLGDPQRNPADAESEVLFREYGSRDLELTDVAGKAAGFAARNPGLTLGILVPTNRLGYEVGENLTRLGVEFDERLQTSRPSRSVGDALGWVLSYTASPLHRGHLQRACAAAAPYLRPVSGEDKQTGADDENVSRLLRSCYRPETLVFPRPGETFTDSLPPVGPVPEADLEVIEGLARFLGHSLRASSLPVEQLLLTVAQGILDGEDTARAQQLASHLRRRRDQHPEWRLPELAADLLSSGRGILAEGDGGFEPAPGRVSLTTMHRAKGLEWDLVYLVGVDGDFFHSRLEERFRGDYDFLGGDPAEMAAAALERALSGPGKGIGGSAAGAEATRDSHVELIAERLRLLYVGITRARRYLSISWSRRIPTATRTRSAARAAAFEVLRSHCLSRIARRDRK
ncbi:MAG: ATP-dependent helicase [Gemmatimonadetes bacterium]|nr:ATP-dependent helicase [Gemmatimonadota bacterium]